ncbi:MAG: hypothetical protein HKL90_04460 [Elusimicrobia bacterium]|nr:hypothetical protein [Elusimicrobiota bacterium]
MDAGALGAGRRALRLSAAFVVIVAATSARADSYTDEASFLARILRQNGAHSVVVLPFPYVDGRRSPGPELVSERIMNELAASGGVKVVDPGLYKKRLGPSACAAAAAGEDKAVRAIGRTAGVEAVVVGVLIDLDDGTVEIDGRVIDVSRGTVLGAGRAVVKKDWRETAIPETRAVFDGSRAADADSATVHSKGLESFQLLCASCHGVDGRGKGGSLAPADVDSKRLDLAASAVRAMTDGELSARIEHGGGEMPPPLGSSRDLGEISPQTVSELVLYVRALGRAANALAPRESDYSSLGLGASVYLSHCVRCHGLDGRGSDHVARSLGVKESDMDLTRLDADDMREERLKFMLDGGGKKMLPLSHPPTQEEIGGLLHYIHALSLRASVPGGENTASPTADVDDPPKSSMPLDENAYAVVVGVEKSDLPGIPPADFAARDARTVYAYLTRAMGFDAKNVVLLIDQSATRTSLAKNISGWLKNRVDARSRVFFYFSGHGSLDPVSGGESLMLYDSDPSYLKETSLPLARLFSALDRLPAKDVSVVLDACFSGGVRALSVAGARPLVSARANWPETGALVFAAAKPDQIGASDARDRHGLFTYYFLSGLHGAADAKGDGRITAEELYAYVRASVERAARLQNIEQTPRLIAAPGHPALKRPWIDLVKRR